MTPLRGPDPNQDVISTAIGEIAVPVTDSQMSAASVRAGDAAPGTADTTPKSRGARPKLPWLPIISAGLIVLIVGGFLVGAAGKSSATPTPRPSTTIAPTQVVVVLPATRSV